MIITNRFFASCNTVEMVPKFVALLLLVAVLGAGYSHFVRSDHPELPADLALQRIDGELQLLADLRGKPLLVTFWSPTCVVCMHEVKALNTLYRDKQGGQAFELLAISMFYDRPDTILETSARQGMQYPVYLDLQRELALAFGDIVVTPTSFLVDPDGAIVYRHVGELDFELLNRKLNDLIG